MHPINKKMGTTRKTWFIIFLYEFKQSILGLKYFLKKSVTFRMWTLKTNNFTYLQINIYAFGKMRKIYTFVDTSIFIIL